MVFGVWSIIFSITLMNLGVESTSMHAEGECLSVMRKLMYRGDTEQVSPGIPYYRPSQGRPGKLGPPGPPGQKGERGDRGGTGRCVCDLDQVNQLVDQVQKLQDFIFKKLQAQDEFCYVGIHDGRIPISSLQVSSFHPHCPVRYAPLQSLQAWCAGSGSFASAWIQVDLAKPIPVFGIVTQGRQTTNQWVTKYKVSSGNNTNSLVEYDENGSVKVFLANNDRASKVVNRFQSPIVARYFRIYPTNYHGYMSMRIELLDC